MWVCRFEWIVLSGGGLVAWLVLLLPTLNQSPGNCQDGSQGVVTTSLQTRENRVPADTNVFSKEYSPKLLGTAMIAADARDLSGLTDELPNGTPHNLFGGISALDRIDGTDEYLAVSDRGPQDGAIDFHCRWHRLTIEINPHSAEPVRAGMVSTTELHDQLEHHFTGFAGAPELGRSPECSRLDPEGLRTMPDGSVWISDEYGPSLLHFSQAGKLLSSIFPPDHFSVDHPNAAPELEVAGNRFGRIPNRGMEGLAISGDGHQLVGIMQSPLIQDCEPDGQYLKGKYCRIVLVDDTGANRFQFVYPLDSPNNVVNEIISIGDNEYLVIERDDLAGEASRTKSVIRISLTGATDISQVDHLDPNVLDSSIVPVRKELFIDMLDPAFGLAGKDFPEKIEALAWGPAIDGHPTLVIASDNDFEPANPTWFYVFAL